MERIVICADHSAACTVAGLTQLERILIEIERWLAARGTEVPAPEIVVRWAAPGLRERQPAMARNHSRLPCRHVVAGAEPGPGSAGSLGGAMIPELPTRVVWPPGGLAAYLSSFQPGQVAAGVDVVDGPDDVARAERTIFRSLGKPSDGYVTRWVHRRVSTFVSRHLARTRVTPNQVSWVVGGLFAAASGTVIHGTFAAFVLATILFKLGDILDGCDGELSRVTYRDSRFGAWLDTTIDMCGNMAFLVAIGAGLSRGTWPGGPGRAWHLHEALVTLVAQAGVILAFARYTRRTSGAAHFAAFGTSLAGRAPAGGWKQRVILGVAGLLRRDLYTWVFILLALAGRPDLILHGAAAIVAAHVPILAYAWWRVRPSAAAGVGGTEDRRTGGRLSSTS